MKYYFLSKLGPISTTLNVTTCYCTSRFCGWSNTSAYRGLFGWASMLQSSLSVADIRRDVECGQISEICPVKIIGHCRNFRTSVLNCASGHTHTIVYLSDLYVRIKFRSNRKLFGQMIL